MNRAVVVGSLVLLTISLVAVVPVEAQRIGIEDSSADTRAGDTTARASKSRDTSTTSSRIIPPEEFGKYRGSKTERTDLSQEALIEKLRADSASMRIRFRERLRELRSDSRAMRKKIRRLRGKVRRLARGSNQGRQQGEEMNEAMDTDPVPTVRKTQVAGTPSTNQAEKAGKPETDARSDTTRQSGSETAGPTELNPNTASLSDLKSISGLSDRLAERIEWYRREVRPFTNRQDLRRVPGIDRSVFNKIKENFQEGSY